MTESANDHLHSSDQPPVNAHTPAALQRKQVHFGKQEIRETQASSKKAGERSPGKPSTSADVSLRAFSNELFCPGPQRQGSWTIEAQRSGGLYVMNSSDSPMPAGGGASGGLLLGEGSPAGSAAAYTPASAAFLQSARKVDDLRGRLESLEQALREMESKAVAHLDSKLQEKVLATAGEHSPPRLCNCSLLQLCTLTPPPCCLPSPSHTSPTALAGEQLRL